MKKKDLKLLRQFTKRMDGCLTAKHHADIHERLRPFLYSDHVREIARDDEGVTYRLTSKGRAVITAAAEA